MKLKSIKKSDAKNKKFTATFIKDGKEKVVQFGDSRYLDFSIGATEAQRKAYRARHNSGASAPADSANALSYHILWNTKSRTKNIELFKKKYNV